jgi:hypothetical protein
MTKNIQRCLIIIFLALSFPTWAQDMIIKNDKSTIKSKVIEITEETIKYKKFANLAGPIFEINKNEVFMIVYKNGSKEQFESIEAQQATEDVETNNDSQTALVTTEEVFIAEETAPLKNDVTLAKLLGSVKSFTSTTSGLSGKRKSKTHSTIIKNYNERGFLIERIDSTIYTLKNVFIRDEKDQLIENIFYKNGALYQKGITEFDVKGNNIGYKSYDQDGNLIQITVFKLNKNGTKKEANIFDKNNHLIQNDIYDANGNLKEMKSYDINNIIRVNNKYNYDERNNEIEVSSTVNSNLNTTSYTKYDSKNQSIEISFSNNTKMNYENEYDAKGNLVKKTTIIRGTKYYVEEITIAYY